MYSCLDDAELAFLGAPWPEYELAARRTGLDILRCVLCPFLPAHSYLLHTTHPTQPPDPRGPPPALRAHARRAPLRAHRAVHPAWHARARALPRRRRPRGRHRVLLARAPRSVRVAAASDSSATAREYSVTASEYANTARESSQRHVARCASSQHAPSQHAPSQHASSQQAPSQHASSST